VLSDVQRQRRLGPDGARAILQRRSRETLSMCGIAGLAGPGVGQGSEADVRAMLQALAHRGPDDEFSWFADGAALGARRLAIIDLDGGRQPLADESGTIVASQNGEIYNYIELREELRGAGHTFRTDCDTEVIVHLYEDLGVGFVERLRGMFAVAIWDGPKRTLVLARDRLGKKPLYWWSDGRRIAYGSELKALLAIGVVDRVVDRRSLERYLQFGFVPAPRTILEGVSKLEPASVMTWHEGSVETKRYWAPSYTPKSSASLESNAEAALELIREAVRLRLRSDVPVGVFLSGGIDSGIVTAIMAEQSASRIRTYSIGFEERSHDELPYARAVARMYGTDHTEAVLDLDAVALLPELAFAYDEPLADPSALPSYRVARLAADHLKVVLNGDGGDESFGGYGRYLSLNRLARLDRVPRSFVRVGARSGAAVLARTGRRHHLRARMLNAVRMVDLSPAQRYEQLMSIFIPEDIEVLLGRPLESGAYLAASIDDAQEVGLDALLRVDLHTYLPDDLLVKMDRATMANSLEARSPFLDHVLVEFGAQLPAEQKLEGQRSKVLLRHIAASLLPPGSAGLAKRGFGVPLDDWFRGDLAAHFEELVLAPDASARDLVDVEVARKLLAEHRAGTWHHGSRLWSLLMLEAWARRWLRALEPASSHLQP
jgi:asparagine synthase (glutamine-hydrolysing)